MPQEPSLGDLVRDFLATFAAYLRQEGAQAVEEVVFRPLRRVARRAWRMAGLIGLALGLTTAAAVFLALSLFNLLLQLTQSVAAAYALAGAGCLLVAALCGLLLSSEARRGERGDGARGPLAGRDGDGTTARGGDHRGGLERPVEEGDAQDDSGSATDERG